MVLSALTQALTHGSAHTIPPDLALAAGAATFHPEEVVAALVDVNPTSSPGPDGIPFSLWMVGRNVWAPLLARLFTAIAKTGYLPLGFNLGTITPLPKPGFPGITTPAGKRPITLLPSVYRLMAKVVTTRFAAALASAIGPEQSGFLPGRRIEDNILLTSLVPSALIALDVAGATIYLDISKAFDTINREFLYRI